MHQLGTRVEIGYPKATRIPRIPFSLSCLSMYVACGSPSWILLKKELSLDFGSCEPFLPQGWLKMGLIND